MEIFRYCLVTAICLTLVNPIEALRFRHAINNLGKGLKKVAKKVGSGLKKVGCKVIFGVGCPLAVGGAGTAIGAVTSGLGSTLAATGVAVGTMTCHVRKNKCRRSVSSGEIALPFSDEFTDYDENADKFISYEEFVFAIMRSVKLADPEDLTEPFIFADANGDNRLSMDEFKAAPFLFAHVRHPSAIGEKVAANTIDVPSQDASVSPAAA